MSYTHKCTVRQAQTQTGRQKDIQTHRQTDRQTDKQTRCCLSQSLQNKLSKEKDKMEATCLIENATSLRDGTRLRSLQGKGAGSWLSAIPTSEKLALKPSKFPLAAYLRLGLPLPFCENIQTRDCGRATGDSSGYHQITCKTGGGPEWSHDSIMSVWSVFN